MTNNWYVLITKPKAQKKVGTRLTELNIENFVPLKKQLRQWHDRKKWVEMPLFYSYIFVHTTEKGRNEVFKADGILCYLTIDRKVCTITADEIERVKLLCSYPGEITIEQGHLAAGDEIEITEGHFAGLCGHITTDLTKTKIRISVPSLHCFATIEIQKSMVQKINAK